MDKGEHGQQIRQQCHDGGGGEVALGYKLTQQRNPFDILLNQKEFIIFFKIGQQAGNLAVTAQPLQHFGLNAKGTPHQMDNLGILVMGFELLDHTDGHTGPLEILGGKGFAEPAHAQNLHYFIALP